MVIILAGGTAVFILLAFALSIQTHQLNEKIDDLSTRSAEVYERAIEQAIRLEKYQQCLADGNFWIKVRPHQYPSGKTVEPQEYCEKRKEK